MSDNHLGPALLSAGIDSAPLGILITDADGRIVSQNAAVRALNLSLPDTVLAAIAAGTFWRGETDWQKTCGNVFRGETTVDLMESGHRAVTVREIAAPRKGAADHHQLIAENSVDFIWLWSLAESRFVFVSPSVERLRGLTVEVALSQSVQQMLTPESCKRAFAATTASIAAVESGDESQRIHSCEFDILHRDGSTVATETIIKLISDRNGKVRYILGVSRDISERKAANIFDGAMEGIYRSTIGGRPITANITVARMLGYDSVDELLAAVSDAATQIWVDPRDRERFIQLLQDQGMVRNFESRHQRKDGRIIWIALNGHEVRGPNGEPLYHEGFIEDITDRKRMEEALRQSEEKFSKAFLSSPALKSIHDVHDKGRILDINESFERVTGYARDEVIGKTIAEIGWLANPETEPEIVRRLLSEGRVRNLEHLFRTKSGEIRTALLSSELIELDGRMCAISARFDITDRKQVEGRMESLATAIEQAAEQIVVTNLDGSIDYCNPAFEKTTGYTREEVLGQNPRVLKSGKQAPEFYEGLWRTIAAGHVWSGLFTNRRKDGTLYDEEATISPVRDASGTIKAYVAVKRDVSERVLLENQLRQAQKLESVGRLAGGVAHDFNNLLTIINGYGDLLLDKLEQFDPLRIYVEEVCKAGTRAAGLTRQLLAFSRKQVFEVKQIDLNALVRDTERMLRRLIGEDIELTTQLEEGLGTVLGDHDQLHQVIMNLAVNARDAMADGGRLVIETQNREVVSVAGLHPDAIAGSYVLMIVTDTGAGMAETTLENIFEPFFTTKGQGKGTGLGLSTVYGIVRQNGGWIEVSSAVGQGTSFRIYLRRVDPEAQPEKGRVVHANAPLGGETVLVVEDQEEVRMLARTILSSRGYQVLDAANGAEAFARAREHAGPIHLLLTDVVMPGVNGRELSEQLRISRPEIKVLFTSGYTADVIAHRGVLEPHVAYLPKPFNAETLAAKVCEVLADG